MVDPDLRKVSLKAKTRMGNNMDDLKSKLQNLTNIATEKLKQPDATKALSENFDRLLINNQFSISIIHTPGTRQFAATLTDDIKAEDIDVSQFSLFQAVDAVMKENPSLLHTDYPVIISDPDTRLTSEHHKNINTLKLVFGDDVIRAMPANSQTNAGKLLRFIKKDYEKDQIRRIHTQIQQAYHRIKLQKKIWLFSIAEANDDVLVRKFKDEFVPNLKNFVDFRLSEIFPPQAGNPTVRDNINSITERDLKMVPLNEIHTKIEETCVLTFESEIKELSESCAGMFLGFLNDTVPGQQLAMPNWSPPEIPGVPVTKPDLNFSAASALISGIWSGVYPTTFAVISAIESGGWALGIPGLVSAAFAVQGYRTAKSQNEKAGIETIKSELNQNSMIAGHRVKYELEEKVKQLINEALRGFADDQRDKKKTTIQGPDQAFLESAEYNQAVKEFLTTCNEIIEALNQYGNNSLHELNS